MTVDKKVEKKNEDEILFPEVIINDITIKPWSFGILFEISPMLDIVLDKIKEKGIEEELDSATSYISYMLLAKVFTIASDQVLKIISITTGESEERIKELSMNDGINIALTIYKQNSAVLKNVLSPQPQIKTKRANVKIEKVENE